MKKIMMTVMVACMGTFGYAQTTTGAAGNTEQVVNDNIIVNADKALNTDFSKYKTFAWASQVKTDNGVYFLNDYVLKNAVRHAVLHELEGLGYEMKDQAADLIVNFRVFDKPVEIQGFTGYEQGYWGTEEYRDRDDQRTYKLDAGSLIVQMVDRTTGQIVWQGYASGIMDNNVFDKDKERINQAVALIFDEYDQRADNLKDK